MTLRVMVVEDDHLHRKMYKAWLTRAGFEAVMVADERIALVVAVEKRPDIALVDIRLPHISGLDIIERLKGTAATASMPVMAVTVLSGRSDEEACFAAGADHFMTKPTNMRALTDAIVDLVEARAPMATHLNLAGRGE